MNFLLILCSFLFYCVSINAGQKSTERSRSSISPLERARQYLLKNHQRIDLINYLILQNSYKNYLEIGVFDGKNFKAVIAEHKIGVDPAPLVPVTHRMTSDDFFRLNHKTFDIIFIDGLHLHEQVLKDIENSLACLNPGGIIIMHDCMPATEQAQRRQPSGFWNGDVWKAVAYVRMHVENVHCCVLDMDQGCGMITPQSTQTLFPAISLEDMDWNYYLKNKKELLNIVSLEQWLSLQ